MSALFAAVVALGLGATDPYVRTRVTDNDPGSHCLRWLAGTLTWHQNQDGYDPDDGRDEFAAISRSFQRWQDVSAACGNLTLVEGPRVPDRKIGYSETDGKNLTLFRKRLCIDAAPANAPCRTQRRGSCSNEFDCWDYDKSTIALTTITFNPENGVILDSDIEYNASQPGGFTFTVVDSPRCTQSNISQSCVATDLENTTTHEAGHFLGLDHTDYPGSTMNPTAVLGETSKRAVDPGSRSFICDAYPKGRQSVPCRVDAPPAEVGEVSGCSAAGSGPALALWGALAGLGALRRRGGSRGSRK